MKHTHYCDPGHGWLAVPRQELIELGIIDKITPYSYERGATVYLEEDCDMSTYARAIEAAGQDFQYNSAPQAEHRSRIRGYDSFKLRPGETVRAIANSMKPNERQKAEQLSLKEFFGL